MPKHPLSYRMGEIFWHEGEPYAVESVDEYGVLLANVGVDVRFLSIRDAQDLLKTTDEELPDWDDPEVIIGTLEAMRRRLLLASTGVSAEIQRLKNKEEQ